jgi:hypothetical protein
MCRGSGRRVTRGQPSHTPGAVGYPPCPGRRAAGPGNDQNSWGTYPGIRTHLRGRVLAAVPCQPRASRQVVSQDRQASGKPMTWEPARARPPEKPSRPLTPPAPTRAPPRGRADGYGAASGCQLDGPDIHPPPGSATPGELSGPGSQQPGDQPGCNSLLGLTDLQRGSGGGPGVAHAALPALLTCGGGGPPARPAAVAPCSGTGSTPSPTRSAGSERISRRAVLTSGG